MYTHTPSVFVPSGFDNYITHQLIECHIKCCIDMA